jgi:hypothetical protein
MVMLTINLRGGAMTPDEFDDVFGGGRGLNQIDRGCLLPCIPDEDSVGLTEDEIKKEYGKRCGLLFSDAEFQEVLRELTGNDVRTTDRTVDGKKVPLYRRTHPRES